MSRRGHVFAVEPKYFVHYDPAHKYLFSAVGLGILTNGIQLYESSFAKMVI